MTFAERIEQKLKKCGDDSRILSVVNPMAEDDHLGARQFKELVDMAQWISVSKKFNIKTTILTEIVEGNEARLLVARNCPEHIFNAMKIVRT